MERWNHKREYSFFTQLYTGIKKNLILIVSYLEFQTKSPIKCLKSKRRKYWKLCQKRKTMMDLLMEMIWWSKSKEKLRGALRSIAEAFNWCFMKVITPVPWNTGVMVIMHKKESIQIQKTADPYLTLSRL